jgi:hypothetical protein
MGTLQFYIPEFNSNMQSLVKKIQVTKGPNRSYFGTNKKQLPPRSPEREALWKEMKQAK